MKDLKTQKKQIRKMIATLRKAEDPTEALELLAARFPFFTFDQTKIKPKNELIVDLLNQQWQIDCAILLRQFAQYGPQGWQVLHDEATAQLSKAGVNPHD